MNNFNPSKLPVHPSVYGKISHIGRAPAATDHVKKPEFKGFKPRIDFAASMTNYRRIAAQDRATVKKYNKEVITHNKIVKAHLAIETDAAKIAYSIQFAALNEDLGVIEYNEAVKKACDLYGPIIKMRREQYLIYAYEQTFSAMLYTYSKQLQERNTLRETYPSRVLEPLPPIDLNARNITKIKREEDVYSVDVCTATVRAQRQIFERKGVLTDYVYRGSNCGVHVRISPEILVVFDDNAPKKSGLENHALTLGNSKELQDNFVSSRSLKRVEKRKPQETVSVDKVSAEPTAQSQEHPGQPAEASDKMPGDVGKSNGVTPLCNVAKSGSDSPGAAAENVEFSDIEPLSNEIELPYEFATKLASGMYDNYRPIDFEVLRRESISGESLSADQFKALFVQMIFKIIASQLYNGRRDIYQVEWQKAYDNWMKNKFKTPGGLTYTKQTIFSYLDQYIWRINKARNWFEARRRKDPAKGTPQYPSFYLNTHDRAGVRFETTYKFWDEHYQKLQLKIDPDSLLKRRAELDIQKRKARNSDRRKLDAAVKKHFAGDMPLAQLEDYVRKNLPAEYMEQLVNIFIERAKKVGITYHA
jgi:hypothetical protein